jgi:hypothetical protein
MIKELLPNTNAEGSKMEIWQTKIRKVRQFLGGWVNNVSGNNKKRKEENLEYIGSVRQKSRRYSIK